MRVLRTVGAALLLTFVAAASSVAQNLLVNPGFESGDLSGWVVAATGTSTIQVGMAGTPIPGVDPVFGGGSSLVRSGTYAASGAVASSLLPQGAMLFSQVLSLVPGATYDIGFYAANSSTLPNTIGIGVGKNPYLFEPGLSIFADGLQLLPFVENVAAPSGTWLPFQASFIANSPTTTVTFKVTGSGWAYAPMSVDDFFVTAQTVTPEPASLGLMATGLGVVLVGVKRRTRS